MGSSIKEAVNRCTSVVEVGPVSETTAHLLHQKYRHPTSRPLVCIRCAATLVYRWLFVQQHSSGVLRCFVHPTVRHVHDRQNPPDFYSLRRQECYHQLGWFLVISPTSLQQQEKIHTKRVLSGVSWQSGRAQNARLPSPSARLTKASFASPLILSKYRLNSAHSCSDGRAVAGAAIVEGR